MVSVPFYRQRRGFTLAELIVGTGLLSLLALLAIGSVLGAKQLLPGRVVQVGEERLAVAPSPSTFAAAVQLHSAFMERLASAKAVYVFGGEHNGLPVGASRRSGAPLAVQALPKIERFPSGLALDSVAFYEKYAGELGAVESKPQRTDFSVITIGPFEGKTVITALLQVRGTAVKVPDGRSFEIFGRRSAVLYDVSGDIWSYAFLEKAAAAASDAVGARHFWYRYFEGRVAEEGPALAVFPDPSIYAGSTASATRMIPPVFSRFAYVLAVSR